jgi:phage shock protein A
MTYITSKPDATEFQENFRHNMGRYPDAFEHFWGMTEHEFHYLKYESWCALIDNIFPDFFPFGSVQDFLMGVVKGVYDRTKWRAYDGGTEKARKIEDGLTDIYNQAQAKIQTEIENAKQYINTNLIDPVRQKANQIESSLKDAQSKLGNLSSTIDNLNGQINTMKSNITTFESQIKTFDTKLASFNSKLSSLDSTASNLQTQLTNAQAQLNQYKTLIDDLDRRVKALEQKSSLSLTLPKLGW